MRMQARKSLLSQWRLRIVHVLPAESRTAGCILHLRWSHASRLIKPWSACVVLVAVRRSWTWVLSEFSLYFSILFHATQITRHFSNEASTVLWMGDIRIG